MPADSVPTALVAALRTLGVAEHQVRPTPPLSTAERGRPRPIRHWLVPWQDGELMIETAQAPEGARRLRLEIGGRSWAEQSGVAVPEVLAADPEGAWLIARAGTTLDRNLTPDLVDEALAIADQMMAQPRPPVQVATVSSWQGDRSGRAIRVARLLVGLLPVRRFVAARRRHAALVDVAVAHNDFYDRNLVRLDGRLTVIDWEFAGLAPRFTDHVRLWTVLHTRELRNHALDRIIAGRTEEELEHLAALIDWLSVRLLAENLCAPRRERTPYAVAHCRRLQPEAVEVVRRLRSR